MIFLAIGIMLAGILLLLAFASSCIRCNTEAEATVSNVTSKEIYWRGKKIRRYTPTLKYSFNGKEYTGKADLAATDSNRFCVGKSVTIFLDKKKPTVFRLGKNIGIAISGGVLLAMGAALCICFFL